MVRVRHSVVDGRVKEYGKTARSRRDVPLTAPSVAAVDALTHVFRRPSCSQRPGAGTSNSAPGAAASAAQRLKLRDSIPS